MKREQITWRSWCEATNANSPGPIARQYNVQSWPTVYLIDHEGVIRNKLRGNPASKRFNAAIDGLVEAAASKGISAPDRGKTP